MYVDWSAPWLRPNLISQIPDKESPGKKNARRWQRARDPRGWKAPLSKNARARRAQILWRYRNVHLYRSPYTSRYAVNKFLRRDAERRQHLRFQRGVDDTLYELMGTPKSQTFESPYIKPKNYRP